MSSIDIGYSPLTKTIQLAPMRIDKNGNKVRVGNKPPKDITNEVAQLVYMLVRDEGGEISWGDKRLIAVDNKEG
jgi:hypothetical protein